MAEARPRSDTIGLRLRQRRRAAGWTQAELAAAARLSQSSISELESEQYEPTASSLRALATALGCTIDELVP